MEKGVETVPCASGWCAKVLETENGPKQGKSAILLLIHSKNIKNNL